MCVCVHGRARTCASVRTCLYAERCWGDNEQLWHEVYEWTEHWPFGTARSRLIRDLSVAVGLRGSRLASSSQSCTASFLFPVSIKTLSHTGSFHPAETVTQNAAPKKILLFILLWLLWQFSDDTLTRSLRYQCTLRFPAADVDTGPQ